MAPTTFRPAPRPPSRPTRLPTAVITPTQDDALTNAASPQSSQHLISAVVNALFAVGLDLASARALVDEDVGHRLDRALAELDLIMSDLRARSTTTAATWTSYHPRRQHG